MKKKAAELKRGDVITNSFGAICMLCPAVVVLDYVCGSVRLHDANGATGTVMIGYDSTVEVESPTLTPAQQHAEEMLDLLRRVMVRVEDPRKLIPQQIRELLDRIEPPEPPSAAELASALDRAIAAIERSDLPAGVADVLARARATGVLK